jgi:hypothetical protein
MTPKEMRKGIRASWRANGVLVKGQTRPGLAIEDIVRAGAARNKVVQIDRLDSWLVVFDEVASWYLSLFAVCYRAMFNRRGRVSRPLARSATVLTAKVFADLLAIRRMVMDGFDVGAQTVLRSTFEHIEALALLLIKPDLAVEFENTKDNEASNQFWNKHLRRGKVRTLLRQELRNLFDEDFAADWDDLVYRDQHGLSMASHPSMMGGFFAFTAPGNPVRDDWPGIFGARADDSWNTLYGVILLTCVLWLLRRDAPFEFPGTRLSLARYKETEETHRHVRLGSKAIIALLLQLWAPGGAHGVFAKVDVSHIWPDQVSR